MAEVVQLINAAVAWVGDVATAVIGWASLGVLLGIPGALAALYTIYLYLRRKDVRSEVKHVGINVKDVVTRVADVGAKMVEHHAEQQKELDIIRRTLESKATAPAAPARGRAVADALADAQKGALAGDKRLERALGLLATNLVGDAEALFQAVADDKAERITRQDIHIRRELVSLAEQALNVEQDRRDVATAYRSLGAIAGLRDPRRALDAYQSALEYDPDDRRSLYWAGYLLIQRGRLDEAQALLDRLLSGNSEPTSSHRFWATIALGDIYFARGDSPTALQLFQDGYNIAEERAQSDQNNTAWQRGLSVAHNKIGDVHVEQGYLQEALKSFGECLDIREDLLKRASGNNLGLKRDLSVSHLRIGEVQLAQGDLEGAMTSFKKGLAIREHLALADAGNAGSQFDLGIAKERIGDVQSAQGDVAAALTSYEAARNIISPLAQSDLGNASWRRALAVSCRKIGDMLKAQGQIAEALKSFRAALGISDDLAQSQRGNAVWQFDLAESHWKLAENGDDAPRRWRLIVAILRKLKAENHLTPVRENRLPAAEAELAKYT
jgi:tetratricopeptide (TPR) repeat protein